MVGSAFQEVQGLTTASSNKVYKQAGVASGIMGVIQRYWKPIGIVAIIAIIVMVFGPMIAEALSGGGADAINQMGQMGGVLDVDSLKMIGEPFMNHDSQLETLTGNGHYTQFKDEAGRLFAQTLDGNVFEWGKDEFGDSSWVDPNFQRVKPSLDLQNFDMTEINNMKARIRYDRNQ
jgi:hypothetical protein